VSKNSVIWRVTGLFGLLAAAVLSAQAQDATEAPAPVKASWRELQLEFPFPSLRTSYRCKSLKEKIYDVMTLIGAHPNTRIGINGCQFDRASGNLFLNIRTAVPVLTPAKSNAKTPIEMSTAKQWGIDPFPAVWKELNLAHERNAKLRPGDCELIHALVKNVLSQMSVTIETDNQLCSPDVMKQQLPDFKVTALVPVKSEASK
jgi:hypothetical protein